MSNFPAIDLSALETVVGGAADPHADLAACLADASARGSWRKVAPARRRCLADFAESMQVNRPLPSKDDGAGG
jgi:hypothetical protein